ncbi:MAG: hypothetical protein ACT4TC_21120 [Myxococcaceae bacterium]
MRTSSGILLGVVLLSGAVRTEKPVKPTEVPLKRTEPSVTAAPGKGVLVTTPDGNFAFGVRGRIQVRDSLTFFPRPAFNEVQLRTCG